GGCGAASRRDQLRGSRSARPGGQPRHGLWDLRTSPCSRRYAAELRCDCASRWRDGVLRNSAGSWGETWVVCVAPCCPLTIVGGAREARSVWHRGRLGTVCARGAHPAWSSGPSTSPLERFTVHMNLSLKAIGAGVL